MNHHPAILVKNLTVTYPAQNYPAVQEVNFSVRQNSITTLIGPNGSGKTTIIKAILGLLEYRGEINIFGQKVNKASHLIGFVPQRFAFDNTFPMTVFEFVVLPLIAQTNFPKPKRGQVFDTLGLLKAQELADKTLASLSGGELQRVLLARSLVQEPRLLLLDEPEAGIDVGGEQTLYDLLDDLVDKKRLTVLIASHELDVVYTYADYVLCVNKRLVCDGTPDQVLNQSTFEKLYGRQIKFYNHK